MVPKQILHPNSLVSPCVPKVAITCRLDSPSTPHGWTGASPLAPFQTSASSSHSLQATPAPWHHSSSRAQAGLGSSFCCNKIAGGSNTHLIKPYKTHKQYIHIYVLYVEKVQISGWKVGHTYMYCIYLDPQSTPRNVINSKLV